MIIIVTYSFQSAPFFFCVYRSHFIITSSSCSSSFCSIPKLNYNNAQRWIWRGELIETPHFSFLHFPGWVSIYIQQQPTLDLPFSFDYQHIKSQNKGRSFYHAWRRKLIAFDIYFIDVYNIDSWPCSFLSKFNTQNSFGSGSISNPAIVSDYSSPFFVFLFSVYLPVSLANDLFDEQTIYTLESVPPP